MKTLIKTSLLVLTLLIIKSETYSQGVVTNYKDGDTSLQGFFVKSKSKLAPGVVIIHQWMGLTDHEKKSALKLSALGYNALAADIYGTGVRPTNTKEAGEKAGYYKTNFETYQSRIKAAINQIVKLGADANNIVVIGYCFGGSGAIETARAGFDVKGVVSIHGGLGKDQTRKNNAINTKVLVLHGADDPFVPEAEVKSFQQEMRDGKADWQMIYYANAVHAFTQPEAGNNNSAGAAYNENAAKRSWEHLKLFLKEVFQK